MFGNFGSISRLWRRKKACVCHLIVSCVGVPDYGAGKMLISSSQEDVRLALDHGVGVKMPDALGLGVGVRMMTP